MKSSYKLFGVVFDKMYINPSLNIEDCLTAYNTSPTEENISIKLSKLLSLNTQEELDKYIKTFDDSKHIYFEIDYIPHFGNKIIGAFYKKLMLQILTYLHNHFNRVEICYDKHIK